MGGGVVEQQALSTFVLPTAFPLAVCQARDMLGKHQNRWHSVWNLPGGLARDHRFRSNASFVMKNSPRSKFSCSVSNLNNLFGDRRQSRLCFSSYLKKFCANSTAVHFWMRRFQEVFIWRMGETFSIIFEYNGRKYHEILPTSDEPLKDTIKLALGKYFEKVKSFSIYVNNSNTPLPTDTESSRYVAGLTVIVRGIDEDWRMRWESCRKSLCYNLSDSSNNRSSPRLPSSRNLDYIDELEHEEDESVISGVVGAASLDDMVPTALQSIHALSKRQSAQTANRRMTFAQTRRRLSEELYHNRGGGGDEHIQMIEARLKMAECLSLSGFDEDLPSSNEDWQMFLENSELAALSEDDKAQQDAIWELIQTEISFIRKMRIMVNTFIHTVRDVLQSSDYVIVQEISLDRLFTNIEEVYHSNLNLWRTYMLPIYELLRSSRKPMDPCHLRPAFDNFAEVLKPYFTYVIDQNSCTEYFKSLYKSNEVFRRVIEWCEARSSERLSFLDLFIQPMQRLTKYKLLLEAILKRTSNEEQCEHLLEMVSSVDGFVKATNTALKCQEQFYSMAQIMHRTGPYENFSAPVELNQLIQDKYADNCKLNLISEAGNDFSRTLVHHGLLKMKDNKEKMDVYCYLLSDMLILLRWRKHADKLKFVRAPIRIDNVDVFNLNDDSRGSFALVLKRDFGFVEAGLLFFSHQSKYWVKCIEAVKREYLNNHNNNSKSSEVQSSGVVYTFEKHNHGISSSLEHPTTPEFTPINHRLHLAESFDVQSSPTTTTSIGSSDPLSSSSLLVKLERPRLIKQNSVANCCYSNAANTAGLRFSNPRLLGNRGRPEQSLKRDDSIMSNCSKKSSSGVSSSSSSLIHALEEV